MSLFRYYENNQIELIELQFYVNLNYLLPIYQVLGWDESAIATLSHIKTRSEMNHKLKKMSFKLRDAE